MAKIQKSREDVISDVLRRLHEAQDGLTIDKPSKKQGMEFTMECFNILFPINARKTRCCTEDESALYRLSNLLTVMLLPVRNEIKETPETIGLQFIAQLPDIYNSLMKDAQAICDFDPASASIEEVIITYPGFFAITAYRIAHAIKKLGVPIVPRLISEYAHSVTGIDINPGAEIGETTVIKNNVKLYQGVTLGALQVRKDLASTKRHPTVEDNVIIYANATILGGDTVIGKGSIIGGNVWITSSVPENSLVYHTNEIKIKTHK